MDKYTKRVLKRENNLKYRIKCCKRWMRKAFKTGDNKEFTECLKLYLEFRNRLQKAQ
jgi:hypothetical protein